MRSPTLAATPVQLPASPYLTLIYRSAWWGNRSLLVGEFAREERLRQTSISHDERERIVRSRSLRELSASFFMSTNSDELI